MNTEKEISTAIVSFADKQALKWADVSWPTMRKFANVHNYDLILESKPKTNRPSSWNKIPILLDALDAYDRICWIDADAVIINVSNSLPEIPKGNDFMIRTTVAELGEVPNCGVMIAKSTTAFKDFLKLAWEQVQFIDNRWWEQAAILHLLGYRWDIGSDGVPTNCHLQTKTNHMSLLAPLPARWNSMPFASVEDPIIKHFAGVKDSEKCDAILSAYNDSL